MSHSSVIQLQNVTKQYGTHGVIRDVSFDIYPGKIVSLLGINGAGKTTLIKMMLGQLDVTKGSIFLNGLDPRKPQARLNVGVVCQTSQFMEHLTAKEHLQFVSMHYPHTESMDLLIEQFHLGEFIHRYAHELSEGQKRCLSLALAFVGKPKIVFLDEPTVGLDVQVRHYFWEFVRNYRKSDTTVILTTHYLEEADALSDRVLILHNGVIKADGQASEICRTFSQAKIIFKINEITPWLSQRADCIKVADNQYEIQTNDADHAVRDMVQNHVPFVDLQIMKSSLQDVFMNMART